MIDRSDWLLLDIGNTAIKWRFGSEFGLAEAAGRVERDISALQTALLGKTWNQVAVSSVAGDDFDQTLSDWLAMHQVCPIWKPVPEEVWQGLKITYKKPASMGIDRWLAMLAVWCQGQAPACVIDVGTALTIDIISLGGRHQGGFVVPGPNLMRNMLSRDTRLINVGKLLPPSLEAGFSTETCVNAGVWIAVLGAVQRVLECYPEHEAILTGGHAGELLDLGLKANRQPDLVLEGLHVWLSAHLDDLAP